MPDVCECVCEGRALAPRPVLKRALALPPAAAPGYAAALFAVEPAGAPADIPALPGDPAPCHVSMLRQGIHVHRVLASLYLGCQLTVGCWCLGLRCLGPPSLQPAPSSAALLSCTPGWQAAL